MTDLGAMRRTTCGRVRGRAACPPPGPPRLTAVPCKHWLLAGRCAPDEPRRWWHGPNRDQGLEAVTAAAAAEDAKARAATDARGVATGAWRQVS